MKAIDIVTEGYTVVRKLAVILKAQRLAGPQQVLTPNGVVWAEAGDILILGESGDKWPIKPDIFERTYEIPTDPGVKDSEDA